MQLRTPKQIATVQLHVICRFAAASVAFLVHIINLSIRLDAILQIETLPTQRDASKHKCKRTIQAPNLVKMQGLLMKQGATLVPGQPASIPATSYLLSATRARA